MYKSWILWVCMFAALLLLLPGAATASSSSGRARSADLTPLIRQLNEEVAELRRTTGAIERANRDWNAKRAKYETDVETARANGDESEARRLMVAEVREYAEFLNSSKEWIEGGLATLVKIDTVVKSVIEVEQASPVTQHERDVAIEGFRTAAVALIKGMGDNPEARRYLANTLELMQIHQKGQGETATGPSLASLRDSIVDSVQVWTAWQSTVDDLRETIRLKSIGWVVRLINEGMTDASRLFEMSIGGPHMDFDAPFEDYDQSFTALGELGPSNPELLSGFDDLEK